MPASKGSALLTEWRQRQKGGKLSQLGLAEMLHERDPKVRASQASVSNWENGVLDPPARVVVLLEAITKGHVRARSWFEPAPTKSEADAQAPSPPEAA